MVSLVITGEKDLACSLVCNEYGEKNRTFENLACSLGMQLKSSFSRTLDLGDWMTVLGNVQPTSLFDFLDLLNWSL